MKLWSLRNVERLTCSTAFTVHLPKVSVLKREPAQYVCITVISTLRELILVT